MTLCAVSMITPTYEPGVGWSRLISVTGGTFPTYEDFEARFNTVCADSDNLFSFGNDPYIGTCKLTCEQLWSLLHETYDTHIHEDTSQDSCERWEKSYSWCSSVLGILGWEWMQYEPISRVLSRNHQYYRTYRTGCYYVGEYRDSPVRLHQSRCMG